MNVTVISVDQAVDRINQELVRAKDREISRSTYYRYELLYLDYFPQTQYRIGKRLIHSDQVLIFVLLVARIQQRFNNMGVTRMFLDQLMKECCPPNAPFVDRFSSFSAVHSFLEQFSNAA